MAWTPVLSDTRTPPLMTARESPAFLFTAELTVWRDKKQMVWNRLFTSIALNIG
jgi:hypothetical protein